MAIYLAKANMADHIFYEEVSKVSDTARMMNYWKVGRRKSHLIVKRQKTHEKL